MDLRLSGKTLLVTGASRGIGEGLAQAFAAEGCALRLAARSAADPAWRPACANSTAPRCRRCRSTWPGRGAIAEVADLAGEVDVLANNACAIQGGSLWDVDEAAWRQGWDLKVFGYIDLTRIVYSRFCEGGGGVILNNIGKGGENFNFDYIAGATGNAALMAFTRALGGAACATASAWWGSTQGWSTPSTVKMTPLV